MSEVEVRVSRIFMATIKAKTRLIVHEGSSRSSKTYSIIQALITKALERPLKITIARDRFTWCRATVMVDFFDILQNQFGLYNPKNHNKSENVYHLNGSTFSFIGLDEAQKLHGRKQDIAWINEAIEAEKNSFTQLAIRTTQQVILDYNPSTDSHWIYDTVIPRNDCTFIKSTYKDNPFLPSELRLEIERLKPTPENIEQGTADEVSWKIYGLGERATQRGLIFGDSKIVDAFPEECKRLFYGLDFGYTNDPTALIKIGLFRGEIYLQQLIYKRGLTNIINPKRPDQPSIEEYLDQLKIPKDVNIWADSSDPKSIADLQNCGYNVLAVKKGPDSIKYGIDIMKRYKINITKCSIDLIKERNNYKWKSTKSGDVTNTPVDVFNHGWDAARYGAMMELADNSPEPNIR